MRQLLLTCTNVSIFHHYDKLCHQNVKVTEGLIQKGITSAVLNLCYDDIVIYGANNNITYSVLGNIVSRNYSKSM